MIVIAFKANDVKDVLQSCRDNKHDRIWLLRTSTSIALSTPDMIRQAQPDFYGSGCADAFGDSVQPSVDAVSIFHKTLKMLHKMSAVEAEDIKVELHFMERDFRVCLSRDGE